MQLMPTIETLEKPYSTSSASAGIALDVRFFLTEAELDEVVAARKTASNSRTNKHLQESSPG